MKNKKSKFLVMLFIAVFLGIVLLIFSKNDVLKSLKAEKQTMQTAEKIANNPMKYYGKKVENYMAPNEVPVGWRIFHSDGENIYLIADYYIKSDYVPFGRLGSKATSASSLNLANVRNDYAQIDDNLENNPAKKLLQKYYDSEYKCIPNRMNEIKFLMDTEVWSVFQSDKAEYAIGAPTLELFVESYNKVHPDKLLDMKLDKKCYRLKWSTESEDNYREEIEGFDLEEFNHIYLIDNAYDRGGMAIISYEGEENEVATTYAIDFKGTLGWSKYNCMIGARPIVCLKEGTQLQKKDNETYLIKE